VFFGCDPFLPAVGRVESDDVETRWDGSPGRADGAGAIGGLAPALVASGHRVLSFANGPIRLISTDSNPH
jgi:hypothetical protein